MRPTTPTSDPQRDGQFWLFADGTRLPVVSGASDAPPADPPAPPADPPAPPADPPRTFTQDEVDGLVGQRLAEDRRRRARDLEETLGMPADQAAQRLKDLQDAERERLTEVERREADAVARETAAIEREARAVETTRQATITGALVAEGVLDQETRADIGVLLERHLTDDAGVRLTEVTGEQVTAAVTALRERRPELFAPAGGSGPTPPPSGDPLSLPPRSGGGGSPQDATERGRNRALAFQGKSASNGSA